MPHTNRLTRLVLSVLFIGLTSLTDLAAQSIEQPSRDETQGTDTQTVIAEGVGATADEAIKGAFRAAVQQVVGAIVDAETMVKDDSIIADSVLTYSDGFVKTFTEIPGSKSVTSGIHRIRIKATVERKALVAKLRAANVSMMSIDGQGLFAEVTSQLQSEADAAAIIAKQFEGFPGSCVKISIIGKPETIEKSTTDATVKFKIQIQPDLAAYRAFRTRLVTILQKVAKPLGEVTVPFKFDEDGYARSTIPLTSIVPSAFVMTPPKVVESMKEEFVLCVETSRTKKGDRADYRGFKVDSATAKALTSVFEKRGKAKLQLTNAEGDVIASSNIETSVEVNQKMFNSSLSSVITKEKNSSFLFDSSLANFDQGAVCVIAPTCSEEGRRGSPHSSYFLSQRGTLLIDVPVRLSHDELRAIKDAKVEISFENR